MLTAASFLVPGRPTANLDRDYTAAVVRKMKFNLITLRIQSEQTDIAKSQATWSQAPAL